MQQLRCFDAGEIRNNLRVVHSRARGAIPADLAEISLSLSAEDGPPSAEFVPSSTDGSATSGDGSMSGDGPASGDVSSAGVGASSVSPLSSSNRRPRRTLGSGRTKED